MTVVAIYDRNLRNTSLLSAFIQHLTESMCKGLELYSCPLILLLHMDLLLFHRSSVFGATPVLHLCGYADLPIITHVQIAKHPRTITTYRDGVTMTLIMEPN